MAILTTTEARTLEAMQAYIEGRKCRSAWAKGVNLYALEILDNINEAITGGWAEASILAVYDDFKACALNGARDWAQASWGGSWLIYNGDIAERLCTPSELKRTHNGERRPNSAEEWLDTQARALAQAFNVVNSARRSAIAQA